MYSRGQHEEKRVVFPAPSAVSTSGMCLPYSYTPSGTLNLDTLKKTLEKKQLHEAAKEILEDLDTSAHVQRGKLEGAKKHSLNHGDQPKKGQNELRGSFSHFDHLWDTPDNWDNIERPRKTNLWKAVKARFVNYINPDVFVKIGKHLFNCHLMVLQSYATYFVKVKYGDTVELKPENVTPEAFHVIYDWMLSPVEEVVKLINKKNVLEIHVGAQFLGIQELEAQCWAFMECPDVFNEETALLLYIRAREKNAASVMSLMLPRISKSFLPLVSTPEFDSLPADVVTKLLGSNFIAVHAEVEVLMAAVKWLTADWERRRHHLIEIMQCIRFGFMGPWQLVDLRRNPLNPEIMALTNTPEVEAMIERSMEFAVHRYRYNGKSDDYKHLVQQLDYTEPAPRNWIGKEHTFITFQQFIRHLENYKGLFGNSGKVNDSLSELQTGEQAAAPSANCRVSNRSSNNSTRPRSKATSKRTSTPVH